MKTRLACDTCGRVFTAERMNGIAKTHRPVSLGPRSVGLVEVLMDTQLPLERAQELRQVLRAICAPCACRLLAESLSASSTARALSAGGRS